MMSRWYVRVPLKWLVFAIVCFFVLFPYPRLFVRHISHVRNLEAMIDSAAPDLAEWQAEVEQRTVLAQQAATTQPVEVDPASSIGVQRIVERLVLERVHYKWDWDVWGLADYMPTVTEMFDESRLGDGVVYEDCDGRAVMAASLMKRLGHQASLVTDFRHVWVVTPEGAYMGPGDDKSLVSTSTGNRIDWSTLASNIPMSLSYGMAVFPLGRELIIAITAYLLMLHRSLTTWRAMFALLLLVQGLLFMRLGFFAPHAVSREVSAWPSWVGIIHVAAAFALLAWKSKRPRH
jgi:hypothetical protein